MKKSVLIYCCLTLVCLFTSVKSDAQEGSEIEDNYLISLKYYSLKDNKLKLKKEILFLTTPKNFSTTQPLDKGNLIFSGSFTVHKREKTPSIFTLTYRINLMDNIEKSDESAEFKTILDKKTDKVTYNKPTSIYSSSGTINITEKKNTVFYSMKTPLSKAKMLPEFMLEITISKYKK